MKRDGKNSNTNLWLLFTFLLGVLALFLANNFTTAGIYDFVSCTFNTHDCPGMCEGWDGNCTEEITDECCEQLPACAGQIVSNPYQCYTYVCYDGGEYCPDEMCYPDYIDGGVIVDGSQYRCTCKNIDDAWGQPN